MDANTDLNADLTQRVVTDTNQLDWTPTADPGVERGRLEQDTGQGRATRFLRFAPGASAAQHAHDSVEEIYVLEGVFSDDRGDFPAGSYLRNPPGSAHTPRSEEGCLLFVTLPRPIELLEADPVDGDPGGAPD